MIVLFNKPFNVLSQFTDNSCNQSKRETLSLYIIISGIYPAGRLDRDSEGLLVLTDNGKLQAKILIRETKLKKHIGYRLKEFQKNRILIRCIRDWCLKMAPAYQPRCER